MRRFFTSLMAVSAVSALLTLTAPAAHAIPVAGDYEFTSGLVGTFTSDGNQLTAWDFYASIVPQMHWRNDGATQVLDNNIHFFQARLLPGYFIGLSWPIPGILPRPAFNTGIFSNSYSSILFSYETAPTTSVPEPSAGLLLLAGLVMLAGYEWRQRRQTRLQIG